MKECGRNTEVMVYLQFKNVSPKKETILTGFLKEFIKSLYKSVSITV